VPDAGGTLTASRRGCKLPWPVCTRPLRSPVPRDASYSCLPRRRPARTVHPSHPPPRAHLRQYSGTAHEGRREPPPPGGAGGLPASACRAGRPCACGRLPFPMCQGARVWSATPSFIPMSAPQWGGALGWAIPPCGHRRASAPAPLIGHQRRPPRFRRTPYACRRRPTSDVCARALPLS
jgi:hypothetical protein